MIKVGLTGSIGMGKSTTAEMFRQAGIPVHDADATVHALYSGEAIEPVEEAFPGTTRNGTVDRRELADRVLGNPQAMQRLEAIVHPLVRQKELEFIANAELAGEKFVILDIPLLFETGGDQRVDMIIVVTAPAEVQRERVLSRPEMSEEKFISILAKQTPDSEKRERADFLIDTSLGMESARTEVEKIIRILRQKSV